MMTVSKRWSSLEYINSIKEFEGLNHEKKVDDRNDSKKIEVWMDEVWPLKERVSNDEWVGRLEATYYKEYHIDFDEAGEVRNDYY